MPDVIFWPLFVTFAAIAIGAVLKMVEALHGKKLSDDECSRLRVQLDALNNPTDELRRKSAKNTAIDSPPQYSAHVVPANDKGPSLNKVDEKNKDISNLTVEEIVTAINSAPPYQKDEISKKYIGIRVNWVGYLKDVMEDPRDKQKVMVNFNVSNQAIIGYSFWLSENPEKFPEIRVLKRESPIRVVGDIESASGGGLCVTLKPISIGVVKNDNL